MRNSLIPLNIVSFDGPNRFLSNFYPCVIVFEGIKYHSAEHAYQASKTNNKDIRYSISLIDTPGQAKRAGRRLVLREDWESVKIDVMREILEEKFSIPELRNKLKNTGKLKLIEGNHWGDTFWGVCNGKGQNNLGKLLMEIRDSI